MSPSFISRLHRPQRRLRPHSTETPGCLCPQPSYLGQVTWPVALVLPNDSFLSERLASSIRRPGISDGRGALTCASGSLPGSSTTACSWLWLGATAQHCQRVQHVSPRHDPDSTGPKRPHCLISNPGNLTCVSSLWELPVRCCGPCSAPGLVLPILLPAWLSCQSVGFIFLLLGSWAVGLVQAELGISKRSRRRQLMKGEDFCRENEHLLLFRVGRVRGD